MSTFSWIKILKAELWFLLQNSSYFISKDKLKPIRIFIWGCRHLRYVKDVKKKDSLVY